MASEILLTASCRYLVSDVYSGYQNATSICNEERSRAGLLPLQNVYCNAHARRKFKELDPESPISQYFLTSYQEIYRVEKEIKDKDDQTRLEARQNLKANFLEMKNSGATFLGAISAKSSEASAINYFINNFDGLTCFLDHARLPIDNNHQERLLRNPVIGRKTWYGTHSKRGAMTAAKLTCKLNKLSPRAYLEQVVKDLHQRKQPYTPRQAAARIRNGVNTC